MTEAEFRAQEEWQKREIADVERILGRKLSPEDLRKAEWMPSVFAERIGIPLRPTLWLKDELGKEFKRKCEDRDARRLRPDSPN